jgi:hypothetical protein
MNFRQFFCLSQMIEVAYSMMSSAFMTGILVGTLEEL